MSHVILEQRTVLYRAAPTRSKQLEDFLRRAIDGRGAKSVEAVMDAPPKMWSPAREETKMDEFRQRVNKELKLTLSTFTYYVKCMHQLATTKPVYDYAELANGLIGATARASSYSRADISAMPDQSGCSTKRLMRCAGSHDH